MPTLVSKQDLMELWDIVEERTILRYRQEGMPAILVDRIYKFDLEQVTAWREEVMERRRAARKRRYVERSTD